MSEVHLDIPHVGEAFLGTLTKQGDDPNSNPWAVTVSLNGKPTQFEIDTGAEVSVISQKAHREIGSPKLYRPQRILRGPSNHALPVKDQFMGKLEVFLGFVGSPSTTTGAGKKGERVKHCKAGNFLGIKII